NPFDADVLQLVQPIRIFAATINALNDADTDAATDAFITLDLDIVYDLELIWDDKDRLVLALLNGASRLSGSDEPPPAWIADRVDPIVQELGTSDPLDLSPLDEFIPEPDKLISEAGVSASKEFTSLAMHFVIPSPFFQEAIGDWTDFYNGNFDSLTYVQTSYVLPDPREPDAPKQKQPNVDPTTATASVSGDWAAWFDSNTFLPKLASDTQQGILDEGQLELLSGVSADWI